MLFVFAAGGTGGHIYPAIAVADALTKSRSANAQVLFIGTGAEIEKRLIGGAGYEYIEVTAKPIVGKGFSGLAQFLLSLPGAISKLRQIYRDRRPVLAFGFGGYPSFLPLIAAKLSGIPTLIQEQNMKSGTANCVLVFIAKKVFAPRNSGPWLLKSKLVWTANPVRGEFYKVAPWQVPAAGRPFRILIVGGSQGAVSLNTAILEMLPYFKTQNVEVVHQAGEKDFERVSVAYDRSGFARGKVSAFIKDMASEYADAHLVICRAGATTVAEIGAAGRPAIFVPLPIAKGHQADNAREAVQAGAALLFVQDAALVKNLQSAVGDLLGKPEKLKDMAERFRKLGLSDSITPAQFMADAALEAALRR